MAHLSKSCIDTYGFIDGQLNDSEMKTIKLNSDDIKLIISALYELLISALYEIGNCDDEVFSLINEIKTQSENK